MKITDMTFEEHVFARFVWRRLGKNQVCAMRKLRDNEGEWPSGFKIGTERGTEVIVKSLERAGLLTRAVGNPRLTRAGRMVLLADAGEGEET